MLFYHISFPIICLNRNHDINIIETALIIQVFNLSKLGNQKFWKSSSASKSVGVEIASYYILARLEMEKSDGVQKALPVVRWITQQRNSNGGFVSTQVNIYLTIKVIKFKNY